MEKAKEILKKNTMLVALAFVALFFAWKTSGAIFDPQNLTNLIAQNGYVVVLAVGMLMCILTGGNIDLSVGSIVCFVGAIAGKLIITQKMNFWLAIIICLIVGALIGAWQGFWIAYIRIPAFIVTLSGMLLWRGAALILLDGLTISPFPDEFKMIFNSYIANPFGGNLNTMCLLIAALISVVYVAIVMTGRMKKIKKGYIVEKTVTFTVKAIAVCAIIMIVAYQLAKFQGIPMMLVLLGIIVCGYAYYTAKTVNGRYLYAMGGNEKAAKLSGVNTNKVLFTAYANMGFLCAVASLMCVARFNSSAPTAGTGYELDAIGSCFIGGASAYGGTGTVPGVI
ncbi:MAG: sugar ABC transporter permease, partial [Lachnospiraceae bacterium]